MTVAEYRNNSLTNGYHPTKRLLFHKSFIMHGGMWGWNSQKQDTTPAFPASSAVIPAGQPPPQEQHAMTVNQGTTSDASQFFNMVASVFNNRGVQQATQVLNLEAQAMLGVKAGYLPQGWHMLNFMTVGVFNNFAMSIGGGGLNFTIALIQLIFFACISGSIVFLQHLIKLFKGVFDSFTTPPSADEEYDLKSMEGAYHVIGYLEHEVRNLGSALRHQNPNFGLFVVMASICIGIGIFIGNIGKVGQAIKWAYEKIGISKISKFKILWNFIILTLMTSCGSLQMAWILNKLRIKDSDKKDAETQQQAIKSEVVTAPESHVSSSTMHHRAGVQSESPTTEEEQPPTQEEIDELFRQMNEEAKKIK